MTKEQYEDLMKIIDHIDEEVYYMDINAAYGQHVDRNGYFQYRDQLLKKLEELKED